MLSNKFQESQIILIFSESYVCVTYVCVINGQNNKNVNLKCKPLNKCIATVNVQHC